jgi:isopenicillin N synthase-like dioxygenase
MPTKLYAHLSTNEFTSSYFPTQPHLASDNVKEGFEIGNPAVNHGVLTKTNKINLSEPNVWPNKNKFAERKQLEQAHGELQAFASQLLSLLAVSLGKHAKFFSSWLENPLSTLRLLHYPAAHSDTVNSNPHSVKLSCTPHTDSGMYVRPMCQLRVRHTLISYTNSLTLLHQDPTGGLEVLNASNEWVPAPYVPGSIVVNIGDLMATVSGGRFTATIHRVRTPPFKPSALRDGIGRLSIPFFFEPGEACVVVPVDGNQNSVVYGEHVRKKMATWVEFQEDSGYDIGTTEEL